MDAPNRRKAYVAPALVEHGGVIAKTEGGGIHPPYEDNLEPIMP